MDTEAKAADNPSMNAPSGSPAKVDSLQRSSLGPSPSSAEPFQNKSPAASTPGNPAIHSGSPQRPFPGMQQANGKGGGGFNRKHGRHRGGKDRVQNNSNSNNPGFGEPHPPRNRDHDEEIKFGNRARLFVGNLSNDTTEDDIRKLFEKFGPQPDVYMDKVKLFAFVRMETRSHAEQAKQNIDGTNFKGRVLRVRFATHSAGIRVKNLSQNVSNELLRRAFERFGEVEQAVAAVDERGRPTGDGVVYFSRKNIAQNAYKHVSDGVFLLGASPRPLYVEMLEQKDLEDGLPEVHVASRPTYQQETEQPPRFAKQGSLEFEFGMRWKKLFENHQKKLDELEKLFQDASATLEQEMETSVVDLEMNKIQAEILAREMQLREMQQKKAQHSGRGMGQAPPNALLQSHQSMMSMGAPMPPPGFGTALPAPGLGASTSSPGDEYMDHSPHMAQGAHMMMHPQGDNMPGGHGGMQGRAAPPHFGMPLPGGPPGFMPAPPRYGFRQPHPQDSFDMGIGQQRLGNRNFDNKQRGGQHYGGGQKRPRN
ncbi:non-POU domain-containing octamer-binding protein-like [Paramacrobiotus metropolitanus]|uniref:non-POU domain-containing octamer-binding protein-like n=1 Tax=Paramacrobiotus metropolitanus TaxID=2943436 RepID=UPI00244563D8|nr:non-POU domain-containing octamer-binding protein-like [Paramacrobiotus metropolitanus]XP_055335721.1 non-POU domain-containing octamer-binding protein-like [Paramacrobiotus metropolitanus]XP_055335727.1 non-POU domain-containing octamer-binding protein-like [Paramacrobiotus metropolitanus]XP_055335735.1 non-POU domain-containing octamer-binding protein-like [Paramacrobiotus metropolitanus]XP_055335743.1 non-POU domain-containing octamer-binding protein-like [Paramacrobiotus metropolitanus]